MEKLLKKVQEMDPDERKKLQKLLSDEKGEKKNMDWMYKGPQKPEGEEYLLGRRIDKHIEEEDKVEENKDAPGASFQENLARRANCDMEAKMREDPLYAIKRKELETRKNLLQNPMKMKQLEKLMKERDKKLKKDKKKKKKKKHKRSSDSDDSDDDIVNKYLAIIKQKKDKSHLKPDDGSRQGRDSHHRSERDKESENSGDDRVVHDRHRHSGEERHDDHSHSRDKYRQSSRSDEQGHRQSQSDEQDHRQSRPDEQGHRRSRPDEQDHRQSRPDEQGHRRSRPDEQGHRRSRPDEQDRRKRSDSENEQQSKSYGLIVRGNPQPKRNRSRSQERSHRSSKHHRSRSRDRSRSPHSRKDSRKSSKSPSRKVPKKKLSSDEMARRRLEMQESARWRDEQREENVKRYRDEDKKEKQDRDKPGSSADFLNPLLMKHADKSTLEDRIKRNMYNVQRTRSDLDKNFTKR